MPQQPPITGDAQEDSWALQVTQELNEIRLAVELVRQQLADRPDSTATTIAALRADYNGLLAILKRI